MSEIDLTRLHTPFDDISGASTASCGQRWVALIFICVSCFGGYFAIDVLPPMQMELMTDLHLDGSVINLFLSPILVSIIGYKNVLLISFLLCGMSLAAVVVYFFLERNASNKNLIHTNKPKGNEKPFKLRDISKFPLQFWLLVIVTPLLYATVNSIISVIVDFLKTQYDFSSFTAGLHSSIIYLVSLVGCALSGAAVDKIGLRLTMLIISCVLLIAFVSLLAYTSV
eukprot:MONOS_11972.1-p1 / transcript=MONOS_11972.1 / gene=MONOS_11972 / organism=Monocercomonoides_exilis_PA203 / gene_product=unspecified product / transcript_product=unspecified product / location=Mono_scaffold00632:257-1820(-) / protein_length=225 / sequence_SO=supercontig / SO=protein_coding / is_pseudo=false